MHSVFGKINYGCLKHLGLVQPSGGWQSLIEQLICTVQIKAKEGSSKKVKTYICEDKNGGDSNYIQLYLILNYQI